MTVAASPALPIDAVVRGSGRPIVLLHGFAAHRFTWRFWMDDLARTHEVHALDLFGCGTAPFPSDDRYGPIEQAEAVLRYVREHDLRRVTLIGHSLGGGIALLVAVRLAELGESHRLAGIVSVSGAAYAQAIPRFIGLFRLPWIGRWLLRMIGPERVIPVVLRSIVFDPSRVTAEQIEGYVAPLRDWKRRRAVVETARSIVPPGIRRLEQRWRTIGTPALLIWGRHDHVVPLWVGDRLAEEMPDAELVVIDRCGHIPSEETPDESLAAVRRFLARVSG